MTHRTPERLAELSDDSEEFDASEMLPEIALYYDLDVEYDSGDDTRRWETTTAWIVAASIGRLYISRADLALMMGEEWVTAREEERSEK